MSTRRNNNVKQQIMRDMTPNQFLDVNGVLYLWDQIKQTFATKDELGEGGSGDGGTSKVRLMLIAYQNLSMISGGGDITLNKSASAFNRKPEVGEDCIVLLMDSNGYRLNTQASVTGYIESSDAYTVVVSGADSHDGRFVSQKEFRDAITGVYKFEGSVATYADLPKMNDLPDIKNGYVYNVEDTNMNYASVIEWRTDESGDYPWDVQWDPLGATFQIESIPNSTIQQIVDGTFGSEG